MTMHHPNSQQQNEPQAISRSYLDIRHVVKQFGSFTALKEISLSIEKGDVECRSYFFGADIATLEPR